MNRNSDAINEITGYLFRTNAIEVCDPKKPFFYTSGKLGPYYINTHFLYGSASDADALLSLMAENSGNHQGLPLLLKAQIMGQYNSNSIFKRVIDMICEKISEFRYDLISGGERRDFFFSIPVAVLTGKPHLSIFKDGSAFLSTSGFKETIPADQFSLSGEKALHIADLVTEASSYIRAWIPALKRLNALISSSVAVVDRNQGGAMILENEGIDFHSLTLITDEFFFQAKKSGYISEEQLYMIRSFTADPDKFMLDFFASDPGFLDRQIAEGGKAKERALRCIENGYNVSGVEK